MSALLYAAVGLVLARAGAGGSANSTLSEESCAAHDVTGPWAAALEDWAVSAPAHSRQGRIMALPPSQGYYVSDRMDGPLQPPPRPPPARRAPPPPAARPYDEWQATPPPPPPSGAGKIVNRPPNPYKDKFKPSYPAPSPNQPIPMYGPPPPYQNAVDRVDEPRPTPQKQVSETDLYLLGAIEKLVYRVDFMEKRLRKMEESMHYLVVGVEAKPEPCVTNFTRVGGGCYHMSSEAVNWKGASYACRRLKANLLEFDDSAERRQLAAALLSDNRLKGGDFWTGGLNPGLLWIWSHSARPVISNSTTSNEPQSASAAIVGEGRCLAWLHDPAAAGYVYRGQDCSLRHRYICEKEEDKTKLSNEIERGARALRAAAGGAAGTDLWSRRQPDVD